MNEINTLNICSLEMIGKAESQGINAIGIMSGSSLDGLDIVLCRFNRKEAKWSYEVSSSQVFEFPALIKERLRNVFNGSALELALLNVDLGVFIGDSINQFLKAANVKSDEVNLIGSHGHTIFHQPGKGLTLQIGCGATIAARTRIQTICDFRTMDVALGGQGAPLVPIGDHELFSGYDICLNIGGIANISFVNSGTNTRIAYDICIANQLLNEVMQEVGAEYDDQGSLARKGSLSTFQSTFDEMNKLPFFSESYPKSLGREFFVRELHPLFLKAQGSIEDRLSLATHHIAYQMAKAMSHVGEVNKIPNPSVLVCGGGAFNVYLLELVKHYAPNLKLVVPDAQTVKFKEAIVFAFLGVLRQSGENNCLSSVTGASTPSCGGCIYQPPKP